MNEATARQIAAADPTASTWLSANAGSGKTRVLTAFAGRGGAATRFVPDLHQGRCQ
jgi:hypothetical protein